MATCEWVIDILQEWADARFLQPPIYVHRGDPGAWDFLIGDFTINDAWHELDLSGIVPANTSAVHLLVTINNTGVGKLIQFRHTSQVNVNNVASCKLKVAGISDWFDIVQALDTNRKIDYYVISGGWTFIGIVARGWWL